MLLDKYLSFVLISCSGALIAFNNLIFKKMSCHKRGSYGYLFVFFILAGILLLSKSYLALNKIVPTYNEQIIAIVLGACMYASMVCISGALKHGPMAISIMIYSSSSILAPIIVSYLIGNSFVNISIYNFISLGLMGLGIAYPGLKEILFYDEVEDIKNTKWAKYISLAVVFHVIYMCVMLMRPFMIYKNSHIKLLSLAIPKFTILIDAFAHIYAGLGFLITSVLKNGILDSLRIKDIKFGLPSSIFLSFSQLLTVSAFHLAIPALAALIWPLFSISIIVLSSVIGIIFYRESVDIVQLTLICLSIITPAVIVHII